MGDSPYKPSDLGEHAERLWDDVTGKYSLRLDELVVLGQACRELDLIEKIADEQAKAQTMISSGYNGQDVADPLVQELRHHRTTLRQLLGQLKLPDDPSAGRGKPSGPENREEVSEKARRAARARWDAVREG